MSDGTFTQLNSPLNDDELKSMEEVVRKFPESIREILDNDPSLHSFQLHLPREMALRFAELIEQGYIIDDQTRKKRMI